MHLTVVQAQAQEVFGKGTPGAAAATEYKVVGMEWAGVGCTQVVRGFWVRCVCPIYVTACFSQIQQLATSSCPEEVVWTCMDGVKSDTAIRNFFEIWREQV